MLSEDPLIDARPTRPRRRRSRATLAVLVAAAVVVLVLRHDYWQWDTPRPLLFGFLPVGLWWQGLVSLLASAMMWLMVRYAWPDELEDHAIADERRRLDDARNAAPHTDRRPGRAANH